MMSPGKGRTERRGRGDRVELGVATSVLSNGIESSTGQGRVFFVYGCILSGKT